MNIGLVVATIEEFETLFDNLNYKHDVIRKNEFKIIHYKIGKNDLFVINSGIGEISAAISTQFIIDMYNIDLIINYGVVGSLRNNLNVGKCVLVKSVVHYDFDLSKIDNVPVGYYKKYKSSFLPLNNEKFDDIFKDLNLLEVICVSGDKFISDSNIKEELAKEFNADICEMELAGIVLTCLHNNVDVISIKAISDSKYGSAEEYNAFAKSSSEFAFKIVKKIIERI